MFISYRSLTGKSASFTNYQAIEKTIIWHFCTQSVYINLCGWISWNLSRTCAGKSQLSAFSVLITIWIFVLGLLCACYSQWWFSLYFLPYYFKQRYCNKITWIKNGINWRLYNKYNHAWYLHFLHCFVLWPGLVLDKFHETHSCILQEHFRKSKPKCTVKFHSSSGRYVIECGYTVHLTACDETLYEGALWLALDTALSLFSQWNECIFWWHILPQILMKNVN